MTDPVEAARQGQAVSRRTTRAPAYLRATGPQGVKEVPGAQLAIVAPPAQEEPLPTPAMPSPIHSTPQQPRAGVGAEACSALAPITKSWVYVLRNRRCFSVAVKHHTRLSGKAHCLGQQRPSSHTAAHVTSKMNRACWEHSHAERGAATRGYPGQEPPGNRATHACCTGCGLCILLDHATTLWPVETLHSWGCPQMDA